MDTASDQARFVPTLTEIVEVYPLALQGPAASVLPTSDAEGALKPSADVPLDQNSADLPLTANETLAYEAVMAVTDHSPTASEDVWSEALTEQMVHRVIQRVDAVLAQRVGEVIASVIEVQTRSLLPSIRQELEFAIRTSVHDAVADELLHMDEAIKAQV